MPLLRHSAHLADRLDTDGVATIDGLLSPDECGGLRAMFDEPALFRSTVDMARYAYGRGRYRYFADPLPPIVAGLREELYPPLAAVADAWGRRLGERTYPATHAGLVAECAAAGQCRPTPLLLRYGPGDHNRLHQDVYGELTFPLQLLVMLSRPEEDFTGGESVFVEQRARQQSLARVLRPRQGDAVVFPVHHRPERGARGDHRVQVRHGVSPVHDGERCVLGVIFHNAP